jgi:hypothetical protein
VWCDLSIPTRKNMRPSTPSHIHLSHLTISHLFDPTLNSWNHDFISSIMNPQGTTYIYKVTLHSRVEVDYTVLKKNSPTDVCTVKQRTDFALIFKFMMQSLEFVVIGVKSGH